MMLLPIEEEREAKIRSLLTDCIEREREAFLSALSNELSGADKNRVVAALDFNLSQNYGPSLRDQFYGVHPVRVARFMAQAVSFQSPRYADGLVAALVHNGIEKGVLSKAELMGRFGSWVAGAVEALTPDRMSLETVEGKEAYYRGIRSMGPEVQVLKCLDKFDNIFSLCLNPNDKVRKDYLEEIRQFVLPMVKEHLPQISSYYRELVQNAEERGHWKPNWA